MKILFIYSLDDVQSTLKPMRRWPTIQFGISYISSVLKAHGHQTRLLVLGSNQRWKDNRRLLKSSIEEFAPGLICFTAIFSQYAFMEKIARFTRNHWPDKFLIIGGVHATLNPNEVINGPFDALCIGEGEYPTLELCRQLELEEAPHGIANLWIKSHNGKIGKNEPRDFLQDINMLPFPDREIWKPWMKEQRDAQFSVLLGRGCPYSCTYCSNHALRKVTRGKYTRFRSPENILKEVAFLYNNYPLRRIYFEVETIAANKTWAIELCRQLEAFNATTDHSLSYGCNFRISPQSMDEELFMAFKKAHFYGINIGLESGSEKIRREVLKRNYSNEDFLNVVSMARKYGLSVRVFNMIGLPGESLRDHMETVFLNQQCQPDGHYTGIFFPYPGTELYNTCIQQGLLKGLVNTQLERRQANLELPYFTKTQIQHAYTWFNYRVYKGHRPFLLIVIQVIAAKIKSYPMTNYLFHHKLPVLQLLHKLRRAVNFFGRYIKI
ncbi:radical SAM protein [Desulfococcaceae bacterium HSG7]|nr:radical SAM protein [Desulfococcaceae bacterium HSG7]